MKENKTILFMAQLPPPVHGAALRNKSVLESQLINQTFRIIPLPLVFADEIKDIGKFSWKKLFLTFDYCRRLIGVLRKEKVDLAYFTMSPSGFAFYRDILIVTILKGFRIKRVYHFRVKGFQKTAKSAFGRSLISFALKDADVICLSRHHLSDLEGFPVRQYFIVPNGIKVELQPHEYGTFANNLVPKILFISNLGRQKGVFDLIEALRILHGQGINFSCSIVGAEHDISFKDLKEVVRTKQLEEHISVCGPKFGTEKLKFLKEADLFVFPTCFELFPGVVLEAMQFGKPIVASTEGSIPEIIDDKVNGLLVPKNNPAALAEKIKKLLLDEKLRMTLGKNAQEKFFAYFTLEKFENNMNETFAVLVQNECVNSNTKNNPVSAN